MPSSSPGSSRRLFLIEGTEIDDGSIVSGGKIGSRWLTSVDKSTFLTYALFPPLYLPLSPLQVKKRRGQVEGERGDFRWGLEIVKGLEFSFVQRKICARGKIC